MTLKAERPVANSSVDPGGMARPGYWIFSPLQDMAFVMFTPLLILLTFALAGSSGWTNGLLAFGLSLGVAHYLPGMLRAYGDRALFRRFRTRLIVAPIFLVTITTWFAYLNLHIVILISLIWGAWHWMMQIYGFARIYDAKAAPSARTPARLEQLFCLMWFGMCVFVLNSGMTGYLTRFYESGGPRLPTQALTTFTRSWTAITVAVTVFYIGQTLWAIREGRRPNPLKFVFIVTTFAYLSYTTSVAERPFMGLVLFESWHDIQYLAIVWMFNLSRARKDPESGSFIRYLFRPKAILALSYVALCLAFGSLTHAWRLFDNQAVVRVLVGLTTATAMMHYYLDGFIWKIREKETSQALGVDSRAQEPGTSRTGPALIPARFPAWSRQALLWLLFVIPAGVFLVIELRGNVTRPLQIYENLVEAYPDSSNAHYELGRELLDAGRLREARTHFERALELTPNLLPARIILGVLLADQQDLKGATANFEQALRLDPDNAELHNNLGIVLDEQGQLEPARTHLERSVALNPGYVLAHNNLGIVLAKLGDATEARVHFERATAIEPQFADAHYQLGTIMMNEGKLPEAKTHFEQALKIDPNYVRAKESLAKAEAALRDDPGTGGR